MRIWPKKRKGEKISLTHLIEAPQAIKIPLCHPKLTQCLQEFQAKHLVPPPGLPTSLQHIYSRDSPLWEHMKTAKNQSCLTLNCTKDARAEQKASPSSPAGDNAIPVLDTSPKNQQVSPGIKQQTRGHSRGKYPNARALEYRTSPPEGMEMEQSQIQE